MRTRLLRTESGIVVCRRCQIADTFWTRFLGLMGRRALGAEEGLFLSPGGSVHTMFMRFPIDVVFLDDELRVLKVVTALRPWRLAGARRARAVVELESGTASVGVGERLVFDE
jgi:uncharacterized membrane protein (UPF0127 family)